VFKKYQLMIPQTGVMMVETNKGGTFETADNRLTVSDNLARTVLDSLSAHIAILDHTGIILETNQAWRNYAVSSGMPETYDGKGDNYLGICGDARGEGSDDARRVADGIRAVISKDTYEFLYDYPCHSPDGRHWYYMRAIRMYGSGSIRIVVSHEDITALKLTEEALRESQKEIEDQKQSLEESNIALKVLLKQRESDRGEMEEQVLTNIKDLVFPYVEKLQNSPLKAREKSIVNIIQDHLNEIISPFLKQLSNAQLLLTPQEMQVATLVKDGKTSKEIADILNVTEATINFHRKNLREKFGLKGKSTGLRAYLMSLT
jgi:DNA-binding CsgD family transcriptional regulator